MTEQERVAAELFNGIFDGKPHHFARANKGTQGEIRIQLKSITSHWQPIHSHFSLPGDMDIDDDMCDEDMGDSDVDDQSTTEDDAKSGVSRQSKGNNGSSKSHGNSSSKPRR